MARVLVQNHVVHPFMLLVIVLFLDQILSPEDLLDRVLVVCASIFGLFPVLGWIHKADLLAPVELVSAIWLMVIGVNIHKRGLRLPNSIMVMPAFAGGITYLWWRAIATGTPAEVLMRLFPQWDNSSHFTFFYSGLINRQYLFEASQHPGDLMMMGREYPTGIHFVWSLFSSPQREFLAINSAKAIPIFAHSVTITLAISAAVAVVAIARIGNNHRQKFFAGVIGVGISLGLITYGPLSQTISSGFSNMPAVVVGAFIVNSVGIKPLKNQMLQWLVLIGGTFSVLYNWYPVVLLLSPILVVAYIRMIRSKRWYISLAVVSVTVIGGLPPVLQTVSLGISHLSVPGGITSFPKPLGLTILLGSFAFGVYLIVQSAQIVNGLTLVFPFLLNFGLALYLRLSTGEYPYYFQKFFLLVCVTTGVLLTMNFVSHLGSDEQLINSAIQKNLLITLPIYVALAMALANMSGYVGPDREKFATDDQALGVTARNEIVSRKWIYEPTMDLILRSAERVNSEPLERKSCYTLFIPDRLGATGKAEQLPWKELLSNVWFHGLTNSYTIEAYQNSYSAPLVTQSLIDEARLVEVIAVSWPKASVCPITSASVVKGLKRLNPQWRTIAIDTK